MDEPTLQWLMDGPAWLTYAVETQLLDNEADVRPVLDDPAIQTVVARLKSPETGLPAIKNGKVHYTAPGKAYWDLFLLADIGLTVNDIGIADMAEDIFRFQAGDGTFTMPPNVQDNYYCMSAILISSLARMGYRDDPRVLKYINAAMSEQMNNGGWDCYGALYGSESCPMDDLNLLMLMGQYENRTNDPALNGAIDMLLSHWQDGGHYYGFGVGKRFRALLYPAVKYGILRVIDVLSLFGHATAHPAFRDMMAFVRAKAANGKYTAEATEPAYADFDFGQTAVPSRWITFIVERAEKRAAEA